MTISEKAETAGSKEIEAGNEQVYTYLISDIRYQNMSYQLNKIIFGKQHHLNLFVLSIIFPFLELNERFPFSCSYYKEYSTRNIFSPV